MHRAITHGRRAGDVVRGARGGVGTAVGPVIQAVVTAVVLLELPAPVRPALPYVLAGVAGMGGAAGCAALVMRGPARRGRSRLARAVRAVPNDLRCGLLPPDVWPQLMLAPCWSWPGTRPRSSSRPESPAAPRPLANWPRGTGRLFAEGGNMIRASAGSTKRGLAGVAHVDSYTQSLGGEICLILRPIGAACRRISQDVASWGPYATGK
jgi:hypothetical protein